MSRHDHRHLPPPQTAETLSSNRLERNASLESIERKVIAQRGQSSYLPVPEPGERIGQRFEVSGLLLRRTGSETMVLEGCDHATGEPLVCKLYRNLSGHHASIAEHLLGIEHPDLVRLREIGLWQGSLYEVMERCQGGSLDQYFPANEIVVKGLLPETLNGLNFLHKRGLVHRNVKPSNMLYRHSRRRDLVLGDLAAGVPVSQGSSILNLAYTAPEVLGGKGWSPHADYYALGVSLTEMLLGDQPFRDLSKREIFRQHTSGRIALPEADDETRELLRGLLTTNPAHRWGYEEVRKWLRGKPLRATPLRGSAQITGPGEEGYPACGAKTPRELAGRLHEFKAETDLFRGRIRTWVERFDPYLADRIAEVEEDYRAEPALGLFKLSCLLDPSRPLAIGERVVHTVGEAIDLLREATSQDDHPVARGLKEALYSGQLECWLEALFDDPKSERMARSLRRVRTEVGNRDTGLVAALHTLAPKLPLRIGAHEVATPQEIARLVIHGGEARFHVERLLHDGVIYQWMLAAFPEETESHEFLRSWRQKYDQAKLTTDRERHEQLWVYAFCWRFEPSAPFPFMGELIEEPWELALRMDEHETARLFGVKHLREGWIASWLELTGKVADPDEIKAIVEDSRVSWDRRLEQVMQLIDATLDPPMPLTDPVEFDLGEIAPNATHEERFAIFNAGRGFMHARLSIEDSPGGVSVTPKKVRGNHEEAMLRIRPYDLPRGKTFECCLVIQTACERKRVPVSFRIERPLLGALARSLRAGVALGILCGMLKGGGDAIRMLPPTTVTGPLAPYTDLPTLATLALTGAAVWGFSVWRRLFLKPERKSARTNDEPPLP